MPIRRVPAHPLHMRCFFSFFHFLFREQALEEEIEGLKAELVSAEAANDELNLELQEMQEREITRCHATPSDSMRRDAIRCDGMGCNGMGWDGIRSIATRYDAMPELT